MLGLLVHKALEIVQVLFCVPTDVDKIRSIAADAALLYRLYRDCVGFQLARQSHRLLANAKTAENHSEKIIRSEFTGDRVQLLLREAQFLGEQVERLGILIRVLRGG